MAFSLAARLFEQPIVGDMIAVMGVGSFVSGPAAFALALTQEQRHHWSRGWEPILIVTLEVGVVENCHSDT